MVLTAPDFFGLVLVLGAKEEPQRIRSGIGVKHEIVSEAVFIVSSERHVKRYFHSKV